MTSCSNSSLSAGIGNIFNYFSCIIVNSIIPLLFAVAIAAFIWGIIQYFLNPENEENRKKGKSYMIWGLVSLFVMLSVWGLVAVIGNTFGVGTVIPQLSQ
jgi:zinc transporter ZupT